MFSYLNNRKGRLLIPCKTKYAYYSFPKQLKHLKIQWLFHKHCETVAIWLGFGKKSTWLGLGRDHGLGKKKKSTLVALVVLVQLHTEVKITQHL